MWDEISELKMKMLATKKMDEGEISARRKVAEGKLPRGRSHSWPLAKTQSPGVVRPMATHASKCEVRHLTRRLAPLVPEVAKVAHKR